MLIAGEREPKFIPTASFSTRRERESCWIYYAYNFAYEVEFRDNYVCVCVYIIRLKYLTIKKYSPKKKEIIKVAPILRRAEIITRRQQSKIHPIIATPSKFRWKLPPPPTHTYTRFYEESNEYIYILACATRHARLCVLHGLLGCKIRRVLLHARLCVCARAHAICTFETAAAAAAAAPPASPEKKARCSARKKAIDPSFFFFRSSGSSSSSGGSIMKRLKNAPRCSIHIYIYIYTPPSAR